MRLPAIAQDFESKYLMTTALDPHYTVEAISMGNGYSLTQYRSMYHKIQLLEAACYMMNPEVIAVVVFFCRNTLVTEM